MKSLGQSIKGTAIKSSYLIQTQKYPLNAYVKYNGVEITKKNIKFQKSSTSSTVMIFKNDLRTFDNPALYFASKHSLATNTSNGLICLFIWCKQEWEIHKYAECKQHLALNAIFQLKSVLQSQKFNIPLIILNEEEATMVPVAIANFCGKVGANALFFNQQYEIDQNARDQEMCRLLETLSIKTFPFHDQCVVPPGLCKTQQGKDYTIFTPYKKCWLKVLEESNKQLLETIPLPIKNKKYIAIEHLPNVLSPLILDSTKEVEIILKDYIWKQNEIVEKANQFIENKSQKYKETRDFPAISGTSGLSPYLALGMISAKYLIVKCKHMNKGKLSQGNEGLMTWISQICWRDFYRNILVAFPHVGKGRAYKLETQNLNWSDDRKAFDSWCKGMTGYPIVDAGMRQLNATGWMHNRLRMICAMFLTKDLFINWKWGEEYFMTKLIDGDFASNNGGWQWSASTGTDAQPYFRVFNPLLQSKKFDSQGHYIAKWVPELQYLKGKNEIHQPMLFIKGNAYPKPIVDHDKARIKVIQAFKGLKESVESDVQSK